MKEPRRAPAQAQHLGIMLRRGLRQPVSSYWDAEGQVWVLEARTTRPCEDQGCGDQGCEAPEHAFALRYHFRYRRIRYGRKKWNICFFELTKDGDEMDISSGIAAVLRAMGSSTGATEAGTGISGSSRAPGRDQRLDARRATVIRV